MAFREPPVQPMPLALLKKWLTVQRAAEMLGVHERTIYNRVWSGEMPSRRVGRHVRVPAEAVDEFLRHGRISEEFRARFADEDEHSRREVRRTSRRQLGLDTEPRVQEVPAMPEAPPRADTGLSAAVRETFVLHVIPRQGQPAGALLYVIPAASRAEAIALARRDLPNTFDVL